MISEFISYEREGRQLSERTCMEYEKDLRQFAIWASSRGLRWSTINTATLMEYQQEHSHLRGTTINRRMTALRMLYGWLMAQGMVKENPTDGIISVITHPRPKKLADVESADEYLIQPCLSREEMDAKLLYALLAESGCRIGEVIDLEVEDLDVDGLKFEVTGKGKKKRTCFYGKRTAFMVMKRTEAYGGGRLFEDMSQRHFRTILSKFFWRYCEGIHPHMLRHTFTTRMHEAGMEMHDLASLLGHSSARTTERYLHLSDEHRETAYRQYAY